MTTNEVGLGTKRHRGRPEERRQVPGPVRDLLRALRDEIERVYGNRLRGVYLYGSYARGTADAESDVDILIVLADFERYGAEVDRTSELVGSLALKYGVSISRVFVREEDWQQARTTFLANVRDEAVPA